MNWLLLRGLTREQKHWGEFPNALKRLHPESRVEFLDLPGCGTERNRRSPASIPAITNDLRGRWLQRDSLDQKKFSLLGISMGGMIALDWCHRFPQDFERLVLLNTSAGNLSPAYDRIRLSALASIPALMMKRDLKDRERKILKLTTGLTPARVEELAQKWAEIAHQNPVYRGTVVMQLWAASHFKAPTHVNVPLLIVAGARDPFTSAECSRRLAKHFNSRLILHPTGQHDLPLEFPDWLAEQIS